MHIPEATLKDIIIRSGVVTEDIYAKAQQESIRLNISIENILIGQFGLNERYFAESVANYLHVPLFSQMKSNDISPDVYSLIPEYIAKAKNVFLFEKDGNTFRLAMLDPNNLDTINYIERRFACQVEPYLVIAPDFEELMGLYKKNIGKEFQRIIDENTKKVSTVQGRKESNLATELPIITMFDTILDHAAASRASDVHIESTEEKLYIRYRIDGVLHDIAQLPIFIEPAIIARIKIMSKLQIDEHRIPQDGRLKFTHEGEDIAVRVSIMPTLHGEKAALRLLASSKRPHNLSELGATQGNSEMLSNAIKRSNGLVLVTGPTGSGKTTTLYTLISMLNTPEVSIATIEDPIEYDMTRVNQTQVNEKTGLTFAEGLRAFLRQNPDIMMVGEIRDKETMELAIHASLTGHLVLSTLHTDDAVSSIPRALDLGSEPFLLASTLRTVIAQRLVRKICPHCEVSKPVSDELRQLIVSQLLKTNKFRKDYTAPQEFYAGSGCSKCNYTGHKGLIGIFEVFTITPKIGDLILQRTSSDVLKDEALRDGMVTMFEDGLEKAESGVTTIDEVFRVIRS